MKTMNGFVQVMFYLAFCCCVWAAYYWLITHGYVPF
jgi:hypothetical protein